MKNLFIHIGGHKTGSTAIQEHLKYNSKFLKKKGAYYFNTYESKNFNKLINERNLKKKNIYFNKFFNQITNIRYNNIIISRGSLSGNIEYKYDDAKIFAEFLKEFKKFGYKVKIIYFVRDPIPFVISSYFQLKKNYKFSNMSFENYLKFIKPETFFLKTIKSYNKWFKNDFIINNYTKLYKNEDQFIDYFWSLISKNSNIKKIGKNINKSYSPSLQYIVNKLDTILRNNEKKKILSTLNLLHKIIGKVRFNNQENRNDVYVDKKYSLIISYLQKQKTFIKLNKKYKTNLKLDYNIKVLRPNELVNLIFILMLIFKNFIITKKSSKQIINKLINKLIYKKVNQSVLKFFAIF